MLARAADRRLPSFERARMLADFSRRLDRVLAGDGGDPALVRFFCAERDRVLHNEVLPALAADGVSILPWDASSDAEQARLRTLFRDVIYPLLTPLAVDSTHPFPWILGRSLHVAAVVRDLGSTRDRFACVPVRDHLFGFGPFDNGFVRLDGERLVSVDVVISALLDDLFHGMQVVEKSTFRLIPAGVGPAFRRLEVDDTTTDRVGEILRRNLNIAHMAVYRMRPPLGLVERIAAIRTARGNGRP